MHMFQNLIDKLKAHPRKIVFTEGTDPRILEASARLLSGTFLTPVLVGNEEEVQAAAEKAAAEKAAAEKAAAEKAAAEKAAAEKARAQSQAAATGERRVTLSTSGACWVQILLPNGRSFFAKEMAEGGSETLNVPVGARVTVGNASVMTLTVDGRPYELTKSTRNGICRFVVK